MVQLLTLPLLELSFLNLLSSRINSRNLTSKGPNFSTKLKTQKSCSTSQFSLLSTSNLVSHYFEKISTIRCNLHLSTPDLRTLTQILHSFPPVTKEEVFFFPYQQSNPWSKLLCHLDYNPNHPLPTLAYFTIFHTVANETISKHKSQYVTFNS